MTRFLGMSGNFLSTFLEILDIDLLCEQASRNSFYFLPIFCSYFSLLLHAYLFIMLGIWTSLWNRVESPNKAIMRSKLEYADVQSQRNRGSNIHDPSSRLSLPPAVRDFPFMVPHVSWWRNALGTVGLGSGWPEHAARCGRLLSPDITCLSYEGLCWAHQPSDLLGWQTPAGGGSSGFMVTVCALSTGSSSIPWVVLQKLSNSLLSWPGFTLEI